MNINFTELTVKIQKMENKHPNFLASAIVTFKEQMGGYLSISGFTIWKSKYEGQGYNVEVPSKPGFKFCLCEKTLWKTISQEVIREYEKFTIPVIEEGK